MGAAKDFFARRCAGFYETRIVENRARSAQQCCVLLFAAALPMIRAASRES
jgi:hypothetical protein